jgi:hypothetical protein
MLSSHRATRLFIKRKEFMKNFRTHIVCELCGADVNKWYDMKEEGYFCIKCYCNIWNEILTDEDFERLEQYEKEENGESL